MSVEQPFEVNETVRESCLSNISSMSEGDKSKYSFIWKAELVDGSNIVQFDGRGEEQSFASVKDHLENGEVAKLHWVPVRSGWRGYTLNLGNIDDAKIMRRGFIQHNASGGKIREGRVYFMKADNKYLWISGDGNTETNENPDFNPLNL